ncbi:hypothetical protein IKJ53_01360, partial [bacterium]|nr:hypothetical protein [bacterium]
MSIKYNGKTVAGRYKAQVVTNATSTQKGIIRIATDEEVKSGVNNAVAVTPEQLFAKVDKQEGKSLISDTEIERLANVDNYDDTEIKTIVKEVESTSKNLSTTVEELKTSKQNKLVAGEDVQLITNEDGTVTIDISATEVLTDDITITQDVNKYITAVGLQTTSNGYIYDWVGTSLEYDIGLLNGTITENTRCLITDDKQDIVLTTPELNMPTKVSDLANESNFTTESKLEEVKSELTNLIDEKVGTGDFVHISGDEFIDGSKTFNSNVNIKGVSSGKLTYVDSVNENNKSYIKINKDGVKFSNDNTAESEKVLLSEDNLIGGDKINIERDGNNFIISSVG